jgi:hypothetical protein
MSPGTDEFETVGKPPPCPLEASGQAQSSGPGAARAMARATRVQRPAATRLGRLASTFPNAQAGRPTAEVCSASVPVLPTIVGLITCMSTGWDSDRARHHAPLKAIRLPQMRMISRINRAEINYSHRNPMGICGSWNAGPAVGGCCGAIPADRLRPWRGLKWRRSGSGRVEAL